MVEREGGVVIVVALHHLPVLSLRSLSCSLSLHGGRRDRSAGNLGPSRHVKLQNSSGQREY